MDVPGTNVKAEARCLLVSRAPDDALPVSTEAMSESGNGGWQLCLGLPCGGGLPPFGLSRGDDQGRNPAAAHRLVSVQFLTDSVSGYRTCHRWSWRVRIKPSLRDWIPSGFSTSPSRKLCAWTARGNAFAILNLAGLCQAAPCAHEVAAANNHLPVQGGLARAPPEPPVASRGWLGLSMGCVFRAVFQAWPIWHCFNLTDTGVCPLSSGPSPASRRVRCRLVVTTFSTACLPPPVAAWPKSTKVLPAHRPNLTTRGLGIGFPGRLQSDARGNWERESGSAVAHANLGLMLSA